MSCRFCGIEQHTVRVVANNAVVTYACGTSFFPTDHELGEPFDSCWSRSKECKAKAPVKDNGKRAARLDTYPVAHVEALEARIAALEAENKALRDRVAEEDTVKNAALNCVREATGAVMRLAPLEAEAKQAREDEAWALNSAVTIHPDGASKSFAPMFWSVRYWDGVRTLEVTAPTIHAALRALRAKVEGGKR